MKINTMKDPLKKMTVAFLLLAALPGARAGGSLDFIATGDTGSATEQQRLVAAALANYADQSASNRPVKFILFLGDNFYEDGVKSVDDPQWQEKFERMYDPKRLPMPFIAVLGNHDWRSDLPDVEVDYAKSHPGTRWQMDAHFYKRQFWTTTDTNAAPFLDLFCIDTEAWNAASPHVAKYPDKTLADRQLAWLAEQLKASHAHWKIVVAHHPLYSNGAHGHDAQLADLRKRLAPLFKENKVAAFITGHDHDLERIERPDEPTLFLITGAGGKLRKQEFQDYPSFFADTPGFISMHLTEKEMTGEFRGVDGKILDVFHRSPP
jgi:acid phosphatase